MPINCTPSFAIRKNRDQIGHGLSANFREIPGSNPACWLATSWGRNARGHLSRVRSESDGHRDHQISDRWINAVSNQEAKDQGVRDADVNRLELKDPAQPGGGALGIGS
jgi:hypothetical protein